MREDVDITDLIAEGNIEKIILELQLLLAKGYIRLYWDGYDSWIKALGNKK